MAKPQTFEYQDAVSRPGPKPGQVKPGALAGAYGNIGGRPAGPGVPAGMPIPAHLGAEALMRSLVQPKPSEWDFGRVYGQTSGGFKPWSR